jgi:hypothetical protein
MSSLPVGQNNYPRPLLADHPRDFQPILKGVLDTSIRDVKRLPPRNAKYLRSLFSLSRAVFRSAARAHFSLCQIEDAGAATSLRHPQQRTPASLLNVVAVGRDSQNI